MQWARRVLVAVALVAASCVLVPARAYFGGPYWVGAAQRDITPDAVVNVGGNGLGDGTVPSNPLFSRGSRAGPGAERIAVRAMVVADELQAVAVADIETQGMFAAYKGGRYGLRDIAAAVAAARPYHSPTDPGLQIHHVLVAADHTHSGPDTVGAWGFVPEAYMQQVYERAVAAIVDAYDHRVAAELVAGGSEARDLVYDQNCTEALDQSPGSSFPRDVCDQPAQDVMDARLRVLQAKRVSDGGVVATLVSYGAHATLGGAAGIHGDWPQFLSDRLAATMAASASPWRGRWDGCSPARPGARSPIPTARPTGRWAGGTARPTTWTHS
jgi:hypothetical protein